MIQCDSNKFIVDPDMQPMKHRLKHRHQIQHINIFEKNDIIQYNHICLCQTRASDIETRYNEERKHIQEPMIHLSQHDHGFDDEFYD